MQLKEVQDWAWQQVSRPPETTREALGRLSVLVGQTRQAFEIGQLVRCQQSLEDVLLATLLAMKSMSINPENALRRAVSRQSPTEAGKLFRFHHDHVEILVNGDIRGHWPMYSQEDYDSALSLARELGCDVVYAEGSQLDLFSGPVKEESHEPVSCPTE